jgi:ATP-dependent Clp protease, protease subunit
MKKSKIQSRRVLQTRSDPSDKIVSAHHSILARKIVDAHPDIASIRKDVLCSVHDEVVVEETPHGERMWDLSSALLKRNIIYISGPIDSHLAKEVNQKLLFLAEADEKNTIYIYIDSPGGGVKAGFSILDTMLYVPNRIITACTGECASMASILFACGAKKGDRLIFPNADVLIHQPLSSGLSGQATDLELAVDEINRLKKLLYTHLAKATGQTFKKIWDDCERDRIFDAEQAVKYGLADRVIQSKKLAS